MIAPIAIRLATMARGILRGAGAPAAITHRGAMLERDVAEGQQPRAQDERGEAAVEKHHGGVNATAPPVAQTVFCAGHPARYFAASAFNPAGSKSSPTILSPSFTVTP